MEGAGFVGYTVTSHRGAFKTFSSCCPSSCWSKVSHKNLQRFSILPSSPSPRSVLAKLYKVDDNSTILSSASASAHRKAPSFRKPLNKGATCLKLSIFIWWRYFPPSCYLREPFFCLYVLRMQELPFLHLGIQNIAGSSTFASSRGRKFAARQLFLKRLF